MYPTLFTTPGLKDFAEAVDAERQRQLAKWGNQRHPDGTAITGDDERAASARHVCQAMAGHGMVSWRDILWEEIAEAFAESDPALLRAELVQCAAVIAAWISDLDSRTVQAGCPAGLLPLGDEPVERCVLDPSGHPADYHQTAAGKRWYPAPEGWVPGRFDPENPPPHLDHRLADSDTPAVPE